MLAPTTKFRAFVPRECGTGLHTQILQRTTTSRLSHREHLSERSFAHARSAASYPHARRFVASCNLPLQKCLDSYHFPMRLPIFSSHGQVLMKQLPNSGDSNSSHKVKMKLIFTCQNLQRDFDGCMPSHSLAMSLSSSGPLCRNFRDRMVFR